MTNSPNSIWQIHNRPALIRSRFWETEAGQKKSVNPKFFLFLLCLMSSVMSFSFRIFLIFFFFFLLWFVVNSVMFFWQDENIYFKPFTKVGKRWSCLVLTFDPSVLTAPCTTGCDCTLCDAVKDFSRTQRKQNGRHDLNYMCPTALLDMLLMNEIFLDPMTPLRSKRSKIGGCEYSLAGHNHSKW